MLISKTAKVRIANSNRKYLESKGYIGYKVGDIIDVSIEHLSKGSHAVIICACDYCGK